MEHVGSHTGPVPFPPDASRSPSLDEISGTSLVSQAREAILDAILSDVFSSRLPPEEVLADMLNVSRTTVRAAVQDLEREGLIKRRRAIGTTVNRHVSPMTLALPRLVGFDWLLAEKGYKVVVESSWERATPSDAMASLPWSPTPECCVIHKRYLADGKLAIALWDYVPWSELKVTGIPHQPPPSLFEFSRQYCHQAITHAIVEIVPSVSSGGAETELDTAELTPFIRLHETHYDDQARATAWTRIDVDHSILSFAVFRSDG